MAVVPGDKCSWSPYDMAGSLAACGYNAADTRMPIPIFPVPEGSDMAGRLAAADAAFMLLRGAMKADKQLLQ